MYFFFLESLVLEGAKIEELNDEFDINELDIIRPSKQLGMCKLRHCVRKKGIRDTLGSMSIMKTCNSSDDDSDKVQINHCKIVKINKHQKLRGKINNRKYILIFYSK